MLATVGDLVEDIVVRLSGPVRVAGDTAVRISRRRGGSAANVAAVAALAGFPARFLGKVGDDPIGPALVAELSDCGVDTAFVRTSGRTGTIVVLVDERGERTMLPDRGASLDLADPDPEWLDGVSVLHVPCYSFTDPPLRDTAIRLVEWARSRGSRISLDISSTAVVEQFGAAGLTALLVDLGPDVVLANAEEASALGIDGPLAGALTVVKRGAEPVTVYGHGRPIDVDVPPIGPVVDSTGAGDAFAAGFLTCSLADPRASVAAGCRAAARVLTSRSRGHRL